MTTCGRGCECGWSSCGHEAYVRPSVFPIAWSRSDNPADLSSVIIFQNVFFVWLAGWLVHTLSAPVIVQEDPQQAAWLLVYLLSTFLPFEAYGAIHKRLNDTLSETVWGFTRGKPARA